MKFVVLIWLSISYLIIFTVDAVDLGIIKCDVNFAVQLPLENLGFKLFES